MRANPRTRPNFPWEECAKQTNIYFFLTKNFFKNMIPLMMNQITAFQPQALQVIRDGTQAAILLQGDRRLFLKMLATPDSASGLAHKLNKPRQKVNYHLRALEKAGLVQLVARRQARNCIERVVQASALSYVISPEVLADLGGEGANTVDRFSSAYLLALAARTIRELGAIREKAQAAQKEVASLSLQADVRFRSPADRNAFAEALANAFARLVEQYHVPASEEGRNFRFMVGAYPAPVSGTDSRTGLNQEQKEHGDG